jgi:hypothetical protein
MTRTQRALLLLTLPVAALALHAAPAPLTTDEKVKDRQTFIPHRKYQSLSGKVVGVLVGDVRAKMGHEGRSGPPDAMGFSAGGNSYRWVYVPVAERPLITNLRVHVGEKGDRTQVFPSLSMANPQTVAAWGVAGPFALVEVEVNGGQGAPAEEGFVATKMTRLDRNARYPLDLPRVVEQLQKRYATWKADHSRELDAAMAAAQRKTLKDRKPTGPRETTELFYITWLPESERVSVRFRTTVTDGAYQFGGGGPFDRPRPLPLPPAPVPPIRRGAARPPALQPPPPPREFPQVRFGTTFGIEYGLAYEVNKEGNVVKTLTLAPESFQKELPLPPGIRPIRPVDPLPPLRLPPRKRPVKD